MRLKISAELLYELERQARAAAPREACGLLIGTRTNDVIEITALETSANLAQGTHAFEIDPALLFRLQRTLRDAPRNIVGVYHSHPHGEPKPSLRDLAGAFYPGYAWLITALGTSGARHAAFWHADDAGAPPSCFEPADMTVS